MSSLFKVKTTALLAIGSGAAAIALITGCGGGGGGSSSTPTVPSPYDDTYKATYVPTDTLASDAKAPTGTLVINKKRAATSFTYFLRPSVIAKYQPQIDDALTKAGVASDIRNNQIPSSITFTGSPLLDGSGKMVFTSSQFVKVCGTASLTVDASFLETGGGLGTYSVSFPNYFTVFARGSNRPQSPSLGTCNNLPNRSGSATFSRPNPTPTPTTSATVTPTIATG